MGSLNENRLQRETQLLLGDAAFTDNSIKFDPSERIRPLCFPLFTFLNSEE